MEIWDGVDPLELTGYARTLLEDRPENQFILEQWLPNTQLADLEWRVDRGIDRDYNGASPLRAFDAEVPIIGRPGRTRLSGELPPLGEKMRLSEYDRLRLNARGSEQIVQSIFNDAEVLLRRARNKLELLRGQALANAAYTFSENGVILSVDFGRDAGMSVSAAISWLTSATAVPITNELTWISAYRDLNGVSPGAVLMSTAARTAALKTTEYRNAASVIATPAYLSVSAFNNVRVEHDLPPVIIYDAKVNGTRVIPEDKIVFLPPAGEKIGDTFWGITAEALEIEIDQADQAGVVVYAMKSQDPVSIWTASAGIALPTVINPDLTMVADVFV